jgi:hypothetical protein
MINTKNFNQKMVDMINNSIMFIWRVLKITYHSKLIIKTDKDRIMNDSMSPRYSFRFRRNDSLYIVCWI